MKALLVLRHAESEDKVEGQTDHQRGLTARGIQQCKSVATFLTDKSLQPDHVLASDATRVKETLEVIFKKSGTIPPFTYLPELYEGDLSSYVNSIRNAPDCQTLLIAGHNPNITSLASFIAITKVSGVGTANLLVFHMKHDSWSKLDKGQCELMEHFSP